MKLDTQKILAERKYLTLLAEKYPTLSSVAAEIINLQAVLGLPKGTEHFMSDLHGESAAFRHILNNASGVIREKIDLLYAYTLTDHDRAELATLIYYPDQKLALVRQKEKNLKEFYRINLQRLIEICRFVASKYTRSRVDRCLPESFSYIMNELLSTNYDDRNKEDYYDRIIHSIIETGEAEELIAAFAEVIKMLAVDTLHIIGDIFDRGPRPDLICDQLQKHHNVDFQWGNHDIVWMGAAAGSAACIATVLLNSLSYNNLSLIENIYGINIRPLALFANRTYGEASLFLPHLEEDIEQTGEEVELVSKMRKAIAVILFKLEGQIILRRPHYHMEKRLLLGKVDLKKGTVLIEDIEYAMRDTDLPTLDTENPYSLSEEESLVMQHLRRAFTHSEKLQSHIRFLYAKGGLYKCHNQNLLFHGCIPLSEDGNLAEIETEEGLLSGRAYLDYAELLARQGYFSPEGSPARIRGEDFLWYLWCGPESPLFGRGKMTTFERLFIEDKSTHTEPRTPYYCYTDNEKVCTEILREFGLLSKHAHIINGHVPVRSKDGESPIKAGGKLILIDGGFCHVYHQKTGIAGYTLIYNSFGMRIVAHEPFDTTERAVRENRDIHSTSTVFESASSRIKIKSTDAGKETKKQLEDLQLLLDGYRSGLIKEGHSEGR